MQVLLILVNFVAKYRDNPVSGEWKHYNGQFYYRPTSAICRYKIDNSIETPAEDPIQNSMHVQLKFELTNFVVKLMRNGNNPSFQCEITTLNWELIANYDRSDVV